MKLGFEVKNIYVLTIILILFCTDISLVHAKENMSEINITGKILTSDDDDFSSSLEEAYFGNKKDFSETITGSDGVVWNIDYKQEISVYGKKYIFAIYKWIGNAAVLVVYEDNNSKLLRIGGYACIFGGNGVDIQIEKFVFSDKKIEIFIKWIGYFHNPANWEELGYAESASGEINLIIDKN